MKKANDKEDMPEEIDFSNAARGKYAGRIANGATIILLEPDVAEFFPDSEAVDSALRTMMRAGLQPAVARQSSK